MSKYQSKHTGTSIDSLLDDVTALKLNAVMKTDVIDTSATAGTLFEYYNQPLVYGNWSNMPASHTRIVYAADGHYYLVACYEHDASLEPSGIFYTSSLVRQTTPRIIVEVDGHLYYGDNAEGQIIRELIGDANATEDKPGLMSPEDKTRLDILYDERTNIHNRLCRLENAVFPIDIDTDYEY